MADSLSDSERDFLKITLIVVFGFIVIVVILLGYSVIQTGSFQVLYGIVLSIMGTTVIVEFTSRLKHRILMGVLGIILTLPMIAVYVISIQPKWGPIVGLVALIVNLMVFLVPFAYLALFVPDSTETGANPELEIELKQNIDLRRTPIAVKFDLEIRSGPKEINALEVQVAHGYDVPVEAWANLDLRTFEVDQIRGLTQIDGLPISRISFLRNDRKRFTLVTFLVSPELWKGTLMVTDRNLQPAFSGIRWISPCPRIYLRFVGLERETSRTYLIAHNKDNWHDPVELLDIASERARTLLQEFDDFKKEARGHINPSP